MDIKFLFAILIVIVMLVFIYLIQHSVSKRVDRYLELPPLGKRYIVKKKTLYSGEEYQKVYFTVIEIYFDFNEDKISEKLIKYFDNEKEAINLRNIYNNRDLAYDTKNKLQDCTDGEIIN